MRKTVVAIFVAALLLANSAASLAQTFGQITGKVADTTGGVLVGASVTVTNTQTGLTRTEQANSAGVYVFPNLPPGVYNVKVELQGFQSQAMNAVSLQVQQTARLDFAMELGTISETVVATGVAPLINITDATVGTVINNEQILELPLNGRNYIQLVALSPNVSADYAPGGGGASGRQGGDRATQNFSIAGQRREYNNYTLDGIVNQDVNFNTYAFLPSIDAVEEFKVQSGVYSAEFGREAAQVNVSTKSGTNAYHATVFEFIRNDAWDALPYQFTSVAPKKSPFKWNQYGFTAGGPVEIPKLVRGRNKLFFMVNYEGFRLRQENQQVYSTPTVAMRNGDFSQAPVIIRDPANNNQPFPGNVIPTSRLSNLSRRLLEFYPEPNIPGAGLSNNYLALQNQRTDKDQFTGRIDFIENQKSFWFGRYSWTNELALSPALKDNGTKVETNVKQAMVSNTRTFSPTVVNEFRFGTTKFYNNLAQDLQYERNIHQEFGLGLFIPEPIAWGLPSFSVSGFSGFGAGAAVPFTGNNYIFQWVDNLTWIRGNHSMKMGAELRRDHYNMIGTQEIRGSLIIDSPVTGYGFADFMLDILSRTASAGALADARYRSVSQAYFFQDNWRLRSNVTLDLGLRYEYTPPWTDLNGQQMNMWIPPGFGTPQQQGKPCFIRGGQGDPYEGVSTRFDPAICVARDGRMGDRLVQPDRTNFAPRLGIVWNPNQKLSVRTGYGIFYVQDTTNPVFDMSRNIQGRITSAGGGLSFELPYAGGTSNPCGVQMPPQVCVQAPQVYANQYDRRTPYIEQYLFNVQRELPGKIAMEVGYFGSRGHRLQRYLTLNQPVPGLSDPVLARAPAPELGNWQVLSSVGYSRYNSLATKLTRRMSGGLQGLVSYTFSKSTDNGSGVRTLGSDQLKPQKGDCASCEIGRSVFDVRHRMVTSLMYELPVGKGRKYLSNSSVLDAIAGGWQLAGIMRMSSGFPLTVTSGVDRSRTAHGYDRPNVVPGVSAELPGNQRSTAAWFNVSAFQMNALGTFGNLGRATLTGPGIFVIDFSALKDFHIASKSFQFRIEAFNLLNRPNFADPNLNMAQSNWNAAGLNSIPTPGSGAFGTISDTRGTVPMRQLQFGLKMMF
jgi:hypothetical protein